MNTKCIRYDGAGGIEVIRFDCKSRHPASGTEVGISIAAVGLNRGDILQRKGFYPAPKDAPQDIPGLEFSGVVEAVGKDATKFAIGDRVMGIVAGGAFSSYLNVDERLLLRVPPALSLTEAAALPEVFLTAFDAIKRSNVTKGGLILLHAAASGVGTAAIQLCKTYGIEVLGTTRSSSKLKTIEGLGARAHLIVDNTFQVQPVDGIIDFIGAAYLKDNIRALKVGGTLVLVGLLGGARGEISLSHLLAKRLKVEGTVLRSRSIEEKAELIRAFSTEGEGYFNRGDWKPVIHGVYPMSELGAAHEEMESNTTVGKIVLCW